MESEGGGAPVNRRGPPIYRRREVQQSLAAVLGSSRWRPASTISPPAAWPSA